MNYELVIKGWLKGELKWEFESLEQVQDFINLSMAGDAIGGFEYIIRIIKMPKEGEEQ